MLFGFKYQMELKEGKKVFEFLTSKTWFIYLPGFKNIAFEESVYSIVSQLRMEISMLAYLFSLSNICDISVYENKNFLFQHNHSLF